jgi:opacity protein-like surface antigen
MKKVLIAALAVLMVFGLAVAQDVNPAIHAGAKSMNFTFNGLGNFGIGPTGPNAGIGGSYFLSNDAAVRAGLQVGLSTTSTPANAPTGTTGTDGSTSSFSFGIAADYLMYMNAGRVRPYWGAGLNFSTTTSDVKYATVGATQDEQQGGTPTTFGLAGIMGAEFFIYSEISLSAEYQLNLVSLTSTSDLTHSNPASTTKMPSSLNILGFGAAGVTLHIYM